MSCQSELIPSPGLLAVARRLKDRGHAAFAVGGAVRDRLVGADPGDWDVATDAEPQLVLEMFEQAYPLGLEHGTVGVRIEGETIEITTFRIDVETDGRHAVVAFGSSLEEDLERRDFTINAIAWDPVEDEIVDPFGGWADLRTGTLRAVGDPDHRFAEDYLRVLRGLRFATRFDLEIDPDTGRGLRAAVAGVGMLSGERVRDELLKTLRECRSVSAVMGMWLRSGVMARLFPELAVCFGVDQNAFHADDVGTHTLLVADRVHPRRPLLRVAALCHDLGKPAARHVNPDTGDWRFVGHEAIGERLTRQALRRMRFSRREIDRVARLVAVHMRLPPSDASDAAIRRWIRDVGEDALWDLYRLQLADWWGNRRRAEEPPDRVVAVYRRARRLLREAAALKVADLAIGGDDLIDAGYVAGPEIGETLEWLLDRVIDEPAVNDRDTLLRMAIERKSGAEAAS